MLAWTASGSMIDAVLNRRKGGPDTEIVGDSAVPDGHIKIHPHEYPLPLEIQILYCQFGHDYLLSQKIVAKECRGEPSAFAPSRIEDSAELRRTSRYSPSLLKNVPASIYR